MAEADVETSDTDRDDAEDGSATTPESEAESDADDAGDDRPATVELSLYELSVSVQGSGADSLDDVEATATNLMDYLVDQHHRLEDGPEDHQVI